MARTLVWTVTRTSFYRSVDGFSQDILGVAESLSGGVAYARKLIDKYYAGQTGTEDHTGWGRVVIELPNVPDTKGVRFTIEPVVKVSSRTQV